MSADWRTTTLLRPLHRLLPLSGRAPVSTRSLYSGVRRSSCPSCEGSEYRHLWLRRTSSGPCVSRANHRERERGRKHGFGLPTGSPSFPNEVGSHVSGPVLREDWCVGIRESDRRRGDTPILSGVGRGRLLSFPTPVSVPTRGGRPPGGGVCRGVPTGNPLVPRTTGGHLEVGVVPSA